MQLLHALLLLDQSTEPFHGPTSHTARAACTRKICRTAQDRPGLQESGAELRRDFFSFLQCRRQACI